MDWHDVNLTDITVEHPFIRSDFLKFYFVFLKEMSITQINALHALPTCHLILSTDYSTFIQLLAF